MANDAIFSLSEQSCSELLSFFEESVNEAVEQIQHVFQDLAEINNGAKYQIVIDHTKSFADNYLNEFQDEVLAIFDQWYDEGESVHQFMIDVEAGENTDDESVVAAHELENALRESVTEAFSIEPVLYEGSTRVELSEYGGKEKLFTDIEDVLQHFINEMENIVNDVERTAEDRGEDNQIYVNVGGILSSLLTAYKTFFEGFSEGMSENLSEHVSMTNDAAMSNVETDKELLKNKAENAGDMLKGISSLFQL